MAAIMVDSAYSAKIYNDLSHVDDLTGTPESLQELSTVIYQHGVSDELLISRMHKHFELKDGEKVILRIDDNKNMITSVPEAGDVANAMPCVWNVQPDGILIPVTFIVASGIHADKLRDMRKKVDECGSTLLLELTSIIKKYGLFNTVGFSLNYLDVLTVPDGTIVNEDTFAGRKQTLSVIHQDGYLKSETDGIFTHWNASARADGIVASMGCCRCDKSGHHNYHGGTNTWITPCEG